MNMHSFLVPRVFLPIMRKMDFHDTTYWVRYADHLEKSQWDSREELDARLCLKLGRMLRHAYANVPFYRKQFDSHGINPDDIRTLEDMNHLPVTARSDIVAHYPEQMLAAGVPGKLRVPGFTSGSTGSPMYFYNDRQELMIKNAVHNFVRGWLGTGMWDTEITIGVSSYFYKEKALKKAFLRAVFGQHSINVSGMDCTLDDFLRIIRTLPGHRRYSIRTYPSYLALYSSEMIERGIGPDRKPDVIVAGAEALSDHRASLIEQAFARRPLRHYGCKELGYIALTCPDNPENMHILGEQLIVRVVDERGKQVKPGHRGRVLVTNLYNRVMPFINYEIGDNAVAGSPCTCGRGFHTIRSIEGRIGEVLRLPGGGTVSEAAVNPIVRTLHLPNGVLRELQLVQTAEDEVCIMAVPSKTFTEEHRDRMLVHFSRMLRGMKTRIETVDGIRVSPSGKRPLIVPLEKMNAANDND